MVFVDGIKRINRATLRQMIAFLLVFFSPISFEFSKFVENVVRYEYFPFLENTNITKSECIAHCKNFWLASLPSVFDFDRIKYEFVTKVNVQN